MSPYVEEMLGKPMNPETMDNEACAKLMSLILKNVRNDYIWGKSELLKYYCDMSYEDWKKTPHTRGNRITSWVIELYFSAKRDMLDDYYGIGGFASPRTVIADWDLAVDRMLKRRIT